MAGAGRMGVGDQGKASVAGPSRPSALQSAPAIRKRKAAASTSSHRLTRAKKPALYRTVGTTTSAAGKEVPVYMLIDSDEEREIGGHSIPVVDGKSSARNLLARQKDVTKSVGRVQPGVYSGSGTGRTTQDISITRREAPITSSGQLRNSSGRLSQLRTIPQITNSTSGLRSDIKLNDPIEISSTSSRSSTSDVLLVRKLLGPRQPSNTAGAGAKRRSDEKTSSPTQKGDSDPSQRLLLASQLTLKKTPKPTDALATSRKASKEVAVVPGRSKTPIPYAIPSSQAKVQHDKYADTAKRQDKSASRLSSTTSPKGTETSASLELLPHLSQVNVGRPRLPIPAKPNVVKALYDTSPLALKGQKTDKQAEYDETYRPPPSGPPCPTVPDKSVSSRPKRVPYEAGKYTLPDVDTPIHEWPCAGNPTVKGVRGRTGKQPQEREAWTGTAKTAHPVHGDPENVSMARSVSFGSTLTALSTQNTPKKSSQKFQDVKRDMHSPHPMKEEGLYEEPDLLDEFAEFSFMAVSQTSSSQHVGSPGTPKAGTKVLTSHSSQSPALQNSGMRMSHAYLSPTHGIAATQTPRRLKGASKSTASPLAVKTKSLGPESPRELAAEDEDADRVAKILANAEAGRKIKEEREKEEQEERKRRIDALLALPDEDDDGHAALSLGTILERPAPQVKLEPERRSIRDLSHPSRPTGSDQDQQKRRKTGPSPFELHLREGWRESRRGLDRATLDFAYRTVTESRSPTHGLPEEEVPYPTPASSPTDVEFGADDGHVDEKPDLDILRQEGLAVDEHLVREGQNTPKNSAGEELEWEGFWRTPELDTGTKSESDDKLDRSARFELRFEGSSSIASLLCDCASRSDWSTMTSIITQEMADSVLDASHNTVNLTSFLLCTILCTSDYVGCSLLLAQLTYALRRAPHHPFVDSERCLRVLIDILWELGATVSFFEDLEPPAKSFHILLDRTMACEVICQIASIAAKKGWLSGTDSVFLGGMLLVLSVEASTPNALRRSIGNTLDTLWPVCLAQQSAHRVVRALLFRHASFSLPVKTQILLTIGQRTKHSRELSRAYAISLLLPDRLDGVEAEQTVSELVHIARLVQQSASDSDVSDETTRDHILGLCEAVSGIADLALSGDERDVEQLESVFTLVQATHLRISLQSQGVEQRNKAMLSTLATTIRLQLNMAKKRRQRRKQETLKGLRTGDAGQLRLAFTA